MHEHEEDELMQKTGHSYGESYVHLSKGRVIFLTEDVTKTVGAQLSALLLYYDHKSPKDEIILYIDSRGGDAAGLTNIYDVMHIISAPVTTVNIGKCYSAGAVLLAAGAKGRRFAFKHSKVMIHGLQSTFPVPGHDVVSSKNYYGFLQENNNNIMKILAEKTGQTLEQVKEDCLRDSWMTPKQALEYGIIDGII